MACGQVDITCGHSPKGTCGKDDGHSGSHKCDKCGNRWT